MLCAAVASTRTARSPHRMRTNACAAGPSATTATEATRRAAPDARRCLARRLRWPLIDKDDARDCLEPYAAAAASAAAGHAVEGPSGAAGAAGAPSPSAAAAAAAAAAAVDWNALSYDIMFRCGCCYSIAMLYTPLHIPANTSRPACSMRSAQRPASPWQDACPRYLAPRSRPRAPYSLAGMLRRSCPSACARWWTAPFRARRCSAAPRPPRRGCVGPASRSAARRPAARSQLWAGSSCCRLREGLAG